MKERSAEAQLEAFLAKYTPEIESLARAVLAKMRARLPGAIQMVYDNYNALVIGFGTTDRPSEAIYSIVLYPRKVVLCFIWGARLPDPHRRLRGDGNQVRSIVLQEAADLDDPVVRELMNAALERAAKPLDVSGPGQLAIKLVSAKQRPRRPASPSKGKRVPVAAKPKRR